MSVVTTSAEKPPPSSSEEAGAATRPTIRALRLESAARAATPDRSAGGQRPLPIAQGPRPVLGRSRIGVWDAACREIIDLDGVVFESSTLPAARCDSHIRRYALKRSLGPRAADAPQTRLIAERRASVWKRGSSTATEAITAGSASPATVEMRGRCSVAHLRMKRISPTPKKLRTARYLADFDMRRGRPPGAVQGTKLPAFCEDHGPWRRRCGTRSGLDLDDSDASNDTHAIRRGRLPSGEDGRGCAKYAAMPL